MTSYLTDMRHRTPDIEDAGDAFDQSRKLHDEVGQVECGDPLPYRLKLIRSRANKIARWASKMLADR